MIANLMARYGRWIWLAWLVGVPVSFAIFEAAGLPTGNTLSRLVSDANDAWPLVSFLLGGLFIGLGVHFFWKWDPKARERIAALEAELAELKAVRDSKPKTRRK